MCMASIKKPRHPFLSTNSDEDGKKPSKSAEWPLKAVAILLDIYVKKFAAGRGYLRGKDWEEVTMRVNGECEALQICKTVKQCRDKVDSLKRRYKMEKRKAVNGNEVTWPFFTKLDEMMGSVFKQARDFEPFDRQHKSSFYYSHEDDEEEDDEDDKQDFSGSPEEYYAMESRRHNTPYYMDFLQNGKAKVEDTDAISEEGLNQHTHRAPLKLLSLTGPQLSTDNSSGQNKHPRLPQQCATGKNHARKRKIEPEHPMRALADAVTGFSEVYARVELAKLEILTTMKLELAKLRRKRHKNSSRKEQASSSSTSSG
eukprot:c22987_g1_i1 orf=707-1645(+)